MDVNLLILHEHSLNGVLGDEMGLENTIQTVALFAQLLSKGDLGPHIVIAASSNIDNWLRELETWCPTQKVLLYHGSRKECRDIRNSVLDEKMNGFNIIITSYNMALSSCEDSILFEYHHAVFDEGYMPKNMTSMVSQRLMKISARRHLLLTGTPPRNNLLELISLLSFVMPEIFADQEDHLKKLFSSWVLKTCANNSREETLDIVI